MDPGGAVTPAEPFLRWAGGKRWLVPILVPRIRALLGDGGRYVEPFLGGGAMFLGVAPPRADLSDASRDLVDAWAAVRDAPSDLLATIMSWPVEKGFYDALRVRTDLDPLGRAARFVYLNRTCYGGVHRTNREGIFNMPFGGGSRTPAALRDRNLIDGASRLLAGDVRLSAADFGRALGSAGPGDVVYCDPPYHSPVRHFDRYGADVFRWEDHLRLADGCRRAMERGAVAFVSNSDEPDLAEAHREAGAGRVALVRGKSVGRAAGRDGARREALYVYDPAGRRPTEGLGRPGAVPRTSGRRPERDLFASLRQSVS